MTPGADLDEHDGDGACCGCHVVKPTNRQLASGLPVCATCASIAAVNAMLEGVRLVFAAAFQFDPVPTMRGRR